MATEEKNINSGAILTNRVVGIMSSLTTMGLAWVVAFLWSLNASFATLTEKDLEKEKKIDAIQSSINDIRDQQSKGQVDITTLGMKVSEIQDILNQKNEKR
ncbi:MAG TPA: hypothetical protein VFV08_05035 [Puia sp.]|nr:hypothetical protein [Puia sp.]